jgi:hypothetical protein
VKKLTAGPNGQVGAVELSDGTVLDTDLVRTRTPNMLVILASH